MSWPASLPRLGRSCPGCGCDDLHACVHERSGTPCWWTTSGECSACNPYGRPDMGKNHERQSDAASAVEQLEDDFHVVLFDGDGTPIVKTSSRPPLHVADLERMREAMIDRNTFQRIYLNRG